MFAIRDGDWKLIEGLGSGGFTKPSVIEPEEGGAMGQLYNLAEDPSETTNLYLERPDIVERLTMLLDEIRGNDHLE
jgi:arylsulfatase A